jgi:hypothetical protein
MGEPMVRFPAVCPDCGREHLASIPVGVFAAALIANDRMAASNQLHEYLAAIVRCPADQRRASTTLKASKGFALIAPPRTSADHASRRGKEAVADWTT